MRKSFILLTMCALAGLWSCQSRIEDETPITYASDESEVEITVAAAGEVFIRTGSMEQS